jgi:4-hydroxy-3-polyprenylbenzoate decarboxylase
MSQRRLVVGISGASGVAYGIRLLQLLRNAGVETHLVVSKTAEVTFAYETTLKVAEVKALANHVHPIDDMAASISSGSFRTAGMIVAPCSMRSMSEIASGVTTTLLTRAADVTLKERRRLVLMVRETPLHTGHLRTMTALSEMGAVIAPPVPAFYAKPETLNDMIDHTVGRVLDLFDIDVGLVQRWGEQPELRSRPSERGRPFAERASPASAGPLSLGKGNAP